MTTQELQAKRQDAHAAAEKMLTVAENQKRPMTASETSIFDRHMREVKGLDAQIAASKKSSSSTVAELRATLNAIPRDRFAQETTTHSENYGKTRVLPNRLSHEYKEGFDAYVTGNGPVTAALYEGVGGAGGYAVPFQVDQKIVPLAPQDSAVRSLATVVETESDVRIPAVLTRGTPALRTETSSFSQAQPGLGDFTLSAFMIGNEIPTSLELLQDVPWALKEMILPDAESGQLEVEEGYYVNGTGSGEPQGLLGNTGTGVVTEPDTAGNLVSVDAIWQVIASLKDRYARNASFLMSRTTALGIRRAQAGSGTYYEPIFRRENGADLLAGYPVAYSASMPAAARGATPCLFGDFKRGYIIGDRGGSALFLKRLDQTPLMLSNGEIVLFIYRRSDGRVRVAEAIQPLNIAAS